MKDVIILPTYNERKNIETLIPEIFSFVPQVFVVVADDNSPDGTAEVVKELQKKYTNVLLFSQQKKEGLGKAYIKAFKHVLADKNVRTITTMDADHSHLPSSLPEMFKKSKDFSVVIGSRYIKGGKTTGWELWRKILSYCGNFYCRMITRIPIHDCTSGFNTISAELLRRIDFSKIDLSGYAFIMELKYVLYKAHAKFIEVPINFMNRMEGESKISGHIISEGMLAPWKMIFRNNNHYRAILLALLIGIISSLPQYIDKSTRPNFSGIQMGVAKDTGFYMARAKDVIDGHSYLTNPYLYEHKSGAPMQFWLPDYILAKSIEWLGVSISSGFILWTFISTTLLALFSYAIVFILTRREDFSILGASLLNIGIFGTKFLRLPPPGFIFIFFLSTFLLFILFIYTKKKKFALGVAISFGTLFNLYPYYWTFYVVVFAVFISTCLLLRLKNIAYKKYALIFCGGLIIGIPYFVSVWQSINLPGYGESMRRLGMIETHFPSGMDSVAVAVITLAVFIFLYRKKVVAVDELNVFLFSGVVSGAIVVNQHLITGKNIEFSSHYMLGNMFWCAFVLMYLLVSALRNKPERVQKMVFGICIVIVTAVSVYGTIAVVGQQVEYRQSEVYIQNYASVFDWFNKNAAPDDVVFANDEISDYVPIFTSQNVYYSGGSILSFMTDDEVENRFIINHYFDTIDTDFVKLRQRGIFGGYFLNEFGHNQSKNILRRLIGEESIVYELVPPAELNRIVSKAKIIQGKSFESELKTYRADYLVWDSNKDVNWKVEGQKFLQKVYSSNGILIYKIN